MATYSEEEEDQFYDTREEISSMSDWSLDGSEECSTSIRHSDILLHSFWNEIWFKNPESVQERRHRFLKWMGLDLDWNSVLREDLGDVSDVNTGLGIRRIMENSGTVLRTSGFEEGFPLSQSTMSFTSDVVSESLETGASEDSLFCIIKNLDDGTEFLVDEVDQDGKLSRLREVRSNRSVSFEEFQRIFGPSPLVQHHLQREVGEARYLVRTKKKVKRGWLRTIGAAACIVDTAALKPDDDIKPTSRTGMQRVRVHPYRKRSKELSSLYAGQEFQAHEGSILTMKFSFDGQYLASAGKDGIVRIWKVIEDERLDDIDVLEIDPSCVYFKMNHHSELASLDVERGKLGKTEKLWKSSDSGCVILPPKVFRILEKPLHEFHGHNGDVLDLSWSAKGFLLSSSVDKTVRLWQVGCDKCLRIFSHNNYVTCVDFNPVDDNYFISGSIDGKVRIWETVGCKVVDYIDIREIVTAVCYQPNGKGKKKSPGKRIAGFQFCPSDPSKVMVTSADSVVRILSGVDIIGKFKGLRNAGSHMSASFSLDGTHIVSANDDSNVYIWNFASEDRTRAKTIWSSESFQSQKSSIAIPWSGIQAMSGALPSPTLCTDSCGNSVRNGWKHCGSDENMDQKLSVSSPDCFSLSRGFLLESLPKGSATWPEEKLSNSSPVTISPAMCKSEYKILKSACQGMFSSPHMWGLVIVTAGWDGRIRTYHNYGLPVRL
ncbi:WD repeat-containing protein 44 [Morella rubra]|uniref:WD repeat-containing protein 44 n=1 Tax=Morella rubra TaxID=262757 RepID=A0A6A1VS69_9ROSI|nr:WD repeat-containing protein 44 [Morella rubra]